MDANEQTTMVVNGALNFLNLALTAWVLTKARDAERELKKNTRVTVSAKRTVRTVRKQTDGKLTALVTMLKNALQELAQDRPKKPPPAPAKRPHKKLRPRGK